LFRPISALIIPTPWKENVQKEKQRSKKHIYKAKGRETRVSLKSWVNSGAAEGSVDPDPLVAPVVRFIYNLSIV
jgi:hypothetical protein